MDPDILTKASFTVLGIVHYIKVDSESPELFGEIWKAFEGHMDLIKPLSTEPYYYGVNFPRIEQGDTDYLAGMAVREDTLFPNELEARTVPAAQYAVFDCTVDKIGETYQHIFSEWLPKAAFEVHPEAASFEKYPAEVDPKAKVGIHIPLRRKTSP